MLLLSHSSWFIASIIFGEKYRSWRSSLFSKEVTSNSLKPTYLIQLFLSSPEPNYGSKTEAKNQTWLYRLRIRKVSGCFSQEWKSHPLDFKLKLEGWHDSEGVVVGSLIFERVDKLGWVSFVRWLWQMCSGGLQRCGKIKTGLWGLVAFGPGQHMTSSVSYLNWFRVVCVWVRVMGRISNF